MDNVPFQNFDDFYSRVHDTSNPIVSSLINSIQQQTGKASPNPLKKDVEIALILSGCFDFKRRIDLHLLIIIFLISEKKILRPLRSWEKIKSFR